jgi:hypothetical protein
MRVTVPIIIFSYRGARRLPIPTSFRRPAPQHYGAAMEDPDVTPRRDDGAMREYQTLLDRIAERARRDDPPTPQRRAQLLEPLSRAALDEAEHRLGFALHPLLAAVYRGIANGGFGPEYALLSLTDGVTTQQAVDCYLARRAAQAGTEWAWPEGVLPILDWGCAMFACVDCRSDDGTVLLFEPNPGDPNLAWWVDSPSLAGWFEHYIHDTGWWNMVDDDFPELQPWPYAPHRSRA